MRVALSAGERLGDHVVVRLIGEGAMAAVFEARHAETGVRVAVKVLQPPLPGDAHALEVAERFRREARALARVRHPNVVGVHAAGVREDGLAWFALDLVEGGDLLGRLRAEGPLPIAEVLRLGEGIARGLAKVHAAGIVHRDLKAANVLLEGPDRRPVITDFGIAQDAQEERLTRAGELLGTPAAMSPEQVLGEHEQVGPPADVWALGALIYHVLVGRPPFEGGTLEQLLVAIAGAAPEPPRALRPEVPPRLEALVLEALARAPGDRPTATALADRLAELAGGARPPGPLAAAAEPAASGRGRALGGALLVAVATVVAALLGRTPPVDVEGAAAAAHAAARAARPADRLARLGLAPPADPAPLASALAALTEVAGRLPVQPGAEPPELAAAQGALVDALAERSASAAIAARDPVAARSALERLAPGPRRSALDAAARATAPPGGGLAPDTAAAIDDLAASLAGLERIDACLAGVDAALALGDAPRAQRLLADAEAAAFKAADGPGGRAVAARVPLVHCAMAEHHARALEGWATIKALQEAAQRAPLAAREGATRASAAAAARWRDDPGCLPEATKLLDQLLELGPPARPAGAAWLARALAREDLRAGWPAFLDDLERALRADPEARLARRFEGQLHIALSGAAADRDAAGALRLMSAGLRLGLTLVIEADLVDGAVDGRAVQKALAAVPPAEAWPLRLLRCRLVAGDVDVAPLTTEVVQGLLADARSALEAPHAPLTARVEARLHTLTAEAQLDPAGHAARCEAAWAEGFPDPRRLAAVALRGLRRARRPEEALVWGPRLIEATLRTADQTRDETLAEGQEGVSDLTACLQKAFDLYCDLLLDAGRAADVLPLAEELGRRGVRTLPGRVDALIQLGRADEALAEAEAAAARAPADIDLEKALERARAARGR